MQCTVGRPSEVMNQYINKRLVLFLASRSCLSRTVNRHTAAQYGASLMHSVHNRSVTDLANSFILCNSEWVG